MRKVGIIKGSFCSALLGLLGLFFLQACGSYSTASQGEPNPPGVFIDSTLIPHLRKAFSEVKACTELSSYEFEDMAVVMMPPSFPSRWYEETCSGEFNPPNTIKLGSPYIGKHEVIQYLLYLNTGNADPTHQSPFFQSCVF